jgi:hypothetical protein
MNPEYKLFCAYTFWNISVSNELLQGRVNLFRQYSVTYFKAAVMSSFLSGG